MEKYDVIVIGAGPAGLIAAGTAAGRGRKTAIIEKNQILGKKLRITGKGRCNVTNKCEPDDVIYAAVENGKFLFSTVNRFSPQDTIDFFTHLGVPLKTERGNRVFPVSDKASDIAEALARYCKDVTVIHERVKKITSEEGRVTGIETDKNDYCCDSVLLATGGLSYPGTGSTGDGYHMAEQLGHHITKLRASLVPLVSDDPDCEKMQGLSLKNCRIKVYTKNDGKCVYEDFGEMLFTHFGVSGPVILSASSHMYNTDNEKYVLSIDLKPALDFDKLDKRIQRDFETTLNKDIINSMSSLLPQKMIEPVIRRSGIDPHIKCNSVTKKMRENLIQTLKDFKVEIKGMRPIDEAIVTAGGVSVNEIDSKTMESKLIKGLYFAGEIIDVSAYTGGFNLQIAFSTGFAAGSHI
jgi:predicted Rossmann fold flavoprotein